MKLCPNCGRLAYANELNRLATAATQAEQAGHPSEALRHWRSALELLPEGTVQAKDVRQRIDALVHVASSEPVAGSTSTPGPITLAGKLSLLGALALFVWKFKWLAAFFLTKGKVLLFGLTKVSTLGSMAVAVWAYALLWGWKFSVGFVVIMYIHEMGHIFALRRLGIRADAPVFIPGLGAFVRLRQAVANPIDDATMGLAGPLWGLGAAVGTAAIYSAFQLPLFAALTHTGGLLNLFNLLPISPLDGGRGLRALSHGQRWLLVTLLMCAVLISGNGLLILILIVGVVRTIAERSSATTVSWRTFAEFAILIVSLTALMWFYDPVRLAILPDQNGVVE